MQPLRVLIVDDEPSICRALSVALRRAGCAPLVAHTAGAAMDLVRAERIDVMVVDLRIPDLRGDVVVHFAAAIQPHLRNSTLLVTGDVTVEAEAILDSLGCPYLRKPFSLGDILSTVFALAPGQSAPALRRA